MCSLHLCLWYACSVHVSRNMHGFGTLSVRAVCMLHKNYMHTICIWQFTMKCSSFELVIDSYTHRKGWSQPILQRRGFKTNSYMTYLAYTLFKNKHDMLLTDNMHVTCLLFTCCSCYMHCACYYYFNMYTTCILLLLQHACCPNMHYICL